MTAGDATRGGKRRRPEPSPALRALGLLVRREHSRPELARKLAARGVAADEAAAAIDKMTAAGWQDDTRFAISLARTRAQGPLTLPKGRRSGFPAILFGLLR